MQQPHNDHFLENLLLFSRTLRRVGLPVSLEQTASYAQALTLIDVGSREQVYFAARGLLVTRREHLRLFDTVFNRFWRADAPRTARRQEMPPAPRHARPKQQFDVISYMAFKARPGDREIDITDKSGTYSSIEILQRKEFSEMTPEELETIKKLMQEMRWQISLRRSRRRVADQKGDMLNLRRALRSAAKYGGVPIEWWWQSRKIKPRPLVVLADISGSMEKYARLMLQFCYGVANDLRDVECFLFGTRLTRITLQIRLRNIDRAVEEAAREVIDWSGGTRIGESLRSFNRRWGRRVLRRGAIVLIISDGWERGDPAMLRQEMRHLQRRCHRLIWLNPLLGKTSYQPLVEGMAAALPFVDDFLPVHNLQSLTVLSQHLQKLGSQRMLRSPRWFE